MKLPSGETASESTARPVSNERTSLPSSASHSLTALSCPPETMIRSLGEKAAPVSPCRPVRARRLAAPGGGGRAAGRTRPRAPRPGRGAPPPHLPALQIPQPHRLVAPAREGLPAIERHGQTGHAPLVAAQRPD